MPFLDLWTETDAILAQRLPERQKAEDEKFDGYISNIKIGDKKYKLRCEVVEVYPMVCPKCGGQLELKYGHGKCEYCGTSFATNFKVVEE